jgi:hypothetical protein
MLQLLRRGAGGGEWESPPPVLHVPREGRKGRFNTKLHHHEAYGAADGFNRECVALDID